MKPGELVTFSDHFISHGENICSQVYLVLRRDTGVRQLESDDSKWAPWHIANVETGKIHVQIGRDLVVLNESR